jgi:hypothetical protein
MVILRKTVRLRRRGLIAQTSQDVRYTAHRGGQRLPVKFHAYSMGAALHRPLPGGDPISGGAG